ncbi:MAG: hypothetical protein KGI52_15100, partial [Burkholderiales bacterium]|nr:hypothetical protein [Burkholderiales bacterium]
NQTPLSTVPLKRLSVYGIKAIVPVTADITVQAGISKANHVTGKQSHDNAIITALKATYKLSKRTSVYGLTTAANNGTTAYAAIDGLDAAGTNHVTGGVAFGIVHAF